MINVFIVVAVIVLFMGYEFLLQFRALFSPAGLIPFSERLQHKGVWRIFTLLAAYRGFRPELEDRTGVPLPDRFLLVANHQSLIDIPVIWRVLPQSRRIRFVAKRELGVGIPFVSFCLRIQGHGLIRRRGDLVRTMKDISRFARRCKKDGACPVIFPEGTRSRTGELGTFHTAGFRRLAEIESLPIVVAALDGGHWVAKIGDVFRNLGRHPYRVRLAAILPPPSGKKEILATLASCRAIIDAALREMRAAPEIATRGLETF